MFSCPFVCLVFIYIYSVSYLLSSKHDFPSQHGGEDHLQVHPEGIVLQVIEVQTDLVGIDYYKPSSVPCTFTLLNFVSKSVSKFVSKISIYSPDKYQQETLP